MTGFFGHVDAMPFIMGVVYFLGLWSLYHKLSHGRIFAFAFELTVFFVLFSMHKGTMAGGAGATIAALLAGSLLTRQN